MTSESQKRAVICGRCYQRQEWVMFPENMAQFEAKAFLKKAGV